MSDCPNCAVLRKKLSPLVDLAFAESFYKKEPVEFYKKNTVARGYERAYLIVARDVWLNTEGFHQNPSLKDVTNVARALLYRGWELTKRNGKQFYLMPISEFEKTYK